jgi:hypothetical protein
MSFGGVPIGSCANAAETVESRTTAEPTPIVLFEVALMVTPSIRVVALLARQFPTPCAPT